jgi:multidrug efflux pump subunit AcrA (membrane-fusion protein)
MIHVEAIVPNETGVLAHGISAMAHVLVRQSKQEEVLVPERCVVFDGLEAIVFRRDPDDPDVVVRISVELGERSGGVVEVFAGLLDGDEVVADGVQQLKRTASGKVPSGMHVHADGSVHDDHK